jgi:hypothetical protein
MTITSLDNFGHASGSISMSELRDYYGQSGAVSLSGDLSGSSNPVPDSLPSSGSALTFSDYRNANRILRKKGTTETKASGSSWSPAQSGCVQYNVYALGGGGSGGGHSTDSGREKVASGAGAGGAAFRKYSVQDHSITSATISIGAGGAGVSYTGGSGTVISGRNGGTTTFNPNGSGATISATGGSRGFGGRQGNIDATVTATLPVGENSSATIIGAWGTCPASLGGSGSGGENNYTGGNGPGLSIGGDGSAATGGGSPNLGSGGVNGSTISASGYAKGATTGAPTKPSEWGSDVSVTFQGGAGVQHSSGAAGASDAGNNYGAGSGGSASESGAGSSGAGSSGAIFVTYYEVNT